MVTKAKNKPKTMTVDDYMALDWSYTLERADGVWIIRSREFLGIVSDGDTVEQAYESIKEPMKCIIEWYLEEEKEIPVPVDANNYKGKIPYRTTPETHFKLAKTALHKGISVNKLIDEAINEKLAEESQV